MMTRIKLSITLYRSLYKITKSVWLLHSSVVLPYIIQRVWILRRFCLKMGVEFAHLGLESGMFFEGNDESGWKC